MRLSKEVKIGLTATIILAASVWGINFLKGKNIFKPTEAYYVVFDQINGLIESGSVYHRGFKVGNINSIVFDHQNTNKFILGITLEERIRIPKNSVVKVKSSSLIASANDLEIVFSNSDEFHSVGDTLQSEANIGIAEILEPMQIKLVSIMSGFDSLLISMNEVLDHQSVRNLQNTISSLDASLAAMQNELKPGGSIAKTLDNMESISTNLADNNEEIAASISNMASITAHIDSADLYTTLLSLDSTLAALAGISNKINNGTGTAGQLINDSSLYTHLDSTAYYLSILLKDMQENPKRYVHFSLFGKN